MRMNNWVQPFPCQHYYSRLCEIMTLSLGYCTGSLGSWWWTPPSWLKVVEQSAIVNWVTELCWNPLSCLLAVKASAWCSLSPGSFMRPWLCSVRWLVRNFYLIELLRLREWDSTRARFSILCFNNLCWVIFNTKSTIKCSPNLYLSKIICPFLVFSGK